MTETCGNCKFWFFLDNQPNTIDVLEGFGICRRYPPSILHEDHYESDNPNCRDQPWTAEGAWCGEWKAKTKETNQ